MHCPRRSASQEVPEVYGQAKYRHGERAGKRVLTRRVGTRFGQGRTTHRGSAPVFWLWSGIGILVSLPVALVIWLTILHYLLRYWYLGYLVRIFQEKPLFIVPRGQKLDAAEDVALPT